MIGPMMVCVAIMAASLGEYQPPAAVDRTADLSTYQEAKKEAGHDTQAHIRLALWCESHGLGSERLKHLAMAVLYDPSNGLARGLMGLVAYQGKWERPDQVSRQVQDDPKRKALMQEYLQRRAKTPDRADDQWKLALWCEQNGLKDQAIAQYHAVLRRDPTRKAAWKRLGFKQSGGRWVTEAQLAAEKAEARAQKHADGHWKPLLTRWRGWLHGKDKVRKQEAETALASATDPRAVPAIWSILVVGGNDVVQAKAAQVLAQIDAPRASRALAMLSLVGRSAGVRRTAAEILRRRDPREFLGLLVGMIRDPLKYQIQPGKEPNSVGRLVIEGPRYNVDRTYLIGSMVDLALGGSMVDLILGGQTPPRYFDSSVPFAPFSPQNLWLATCGMMGPVMPGNLFLNAPGVSLLPRLAAVAGGKNPQQTAINNAVLNAETLAAREDILIAQRLMAAQQVVELSRQQLRNDIQAIEAYNANVQTVNNQVLPILTDLTGRDLGPSGEAWQAWWADQQGYAYSTADPSTKPTYTEIVTNPISPPHHACFGAGTLVRTLNGPQAIESIRVGDQVLSQDVRAGKLSFTPIVAVFHNKPAATLRVRLGDEPIVVTGIHRFWKAGLGWSMARELRPGDTIRVLGGTARVVSVEDAPVQPVFNLEVAEEQSFFVGALGALVHDNSLVQPVPDPFDAVSAPAVRPASRR